VLRIICDSFLGLFDSLLAVESCRQSRGAALGLKHQGVKDNVNANEQPIELKWMQADTGAEVGGEGHSQSLTARASIDRQYWQSGLEEIPSAPQSNNGGSYIGCLGFCHGATSSRYRSTLPACLRWENREIAGLFLAGGGDSCRSRGAYVKPMYR
jgi:hypothetical protein